MAARAIFMVLWIAFSLMACAGLQQSSALPVVVKAEDLVGRGYERIGHVQVAKERYGVDVLSADDYGWAHVALQEEARKIGADAILQPELTINSQSLLLVPITEIRARATAIRFR